MSPSGDDHFPAGSSVSIGIRVAPTFGGIMKHAAALIVLLTIAAAPVTTFACIAWCATDGVPMSEACQHRKQSTAAVRVIAADDVCVQLLAVRPFLREETQPTTLAVLDTSRPPASFIVALGEAQLVSVHDVGSPGSLRPTSSLVLRL